MPPLNLNNQDSSISNQVIPESGGSKKRWLIISVVILLIILLGALWYFFPKLSSNKPTGNNFVLNTSDTLPPLNAETRQYFADDTNALLKNIGINQDAFNLDTNSKATLSNIITSLNSSSTKVIYNTLSYTGVEKFSKADTYYLKPTLSQIPEAEYLLVVKKENIKPAELLNSRSNPIDRDIYKIFYDNYVANKSTTDSVAALKIYLDKLVAAKTIVKYTYGDIDGNLRIYYPNEEIGFQLNPSLYAEAMDKVISGYANPSKYIDDALANYQFQFSQGDVLIINTKNQATSTRTINRELLKKNLSILLDDRLTKEEKLTALASRVRFGNIEEKNVSSKTPVSNLAAVALASGSSDINDLLNQPGTIVPPNKVVSIVLGSNSAGSGILGNFYPEEFEKTNGALSAFKQNDYLLNVINSGDTRTMSEPIIEKFADLMENDRATNIIYDGHGAESGGLLMESYYLGDSGGEDDTSTDPILLANRENFLKRISILSLKYGSSSIDFSENKKVLTVEQLKEFGYDVESLISLGKNLASTDRVIANIYIQPDFFEKFKKEGHKKSLVILDACYSGIYIPNINSKVILTTLGSSITTDGMFIYSDLAKMNKYLSKDINPGSIDFDTDKFRNYNILTRFNIERVILNSLSTKEEKDSFDTRVKACIVKPDTLCTIVPSGSVYGQTIAISPNVKTASGDGIIFNAPMESQVPAENVVTIDASKCGTSAKILSENKPVWNGDRGIALSWNNKVYRDWDVDTDFDVSGKPKVNYAVISVKNDQAVSKISQVRLTGNSDACISAGCFQNESFMDPAGLKYNGNNPKTDFVMMMPCIEEDYYSACTVATGPAYIVKLKNEKGRIGPDYINFGGNCYHKIQATDSDKLVAVEIDNWTDAVNCKSKCVETAPPKTLPVKNLSCDSLLTKEDVKGIFGKQYDEGTGVGISLTRSNCVYVFDIKPIKTSLDITVKPWSNNISNTICELSTTCDPISGLGDRAFLGKYSGFNTLYSQSAGYLISISGINPSDLDDIKQLVQIMVNRLPR